jgi:TRAP-type C4-dicarboxylate transport system permease small subunit
MSTSSSDDLLSQVEHLSATELEETTPPSRYLVVRLVDRVVEMLAATTLAGITLLMFANATSRYLFSAPIGWTEEIVTGLLLWLTMFGLFIGVRRRELIIIRVFTRRLTLRNQTRTKMFADAVTAVIFAHLAWVGLQYLLTFGSDASAYLRLPKGFFTAAIPIGAIAVALTLLLQMRSNRELVTSWVEEDRESASPDATVPPVTSAQPVSRSFP